MEIKIKFLFFLFNINKYPPNILFTSENVCQIFYFSNFRLKLKKNKNLISPPLKECNFSRKDIRIYNYIKILIFNKKLSPKRISHKSYEKNGFNQINSDQKKIS